MTRGLLAENLRKRGLQATGECRAYEKENSYDVCFPSFRSRLKWKRADNVFIDRPILRTSPRRRRRKNIVPDHCAQWAKEVFALGTSFTEMIKYECSFGSLYIRQASRISTRTRTLSATTFESTASMPPPSAAVMNSCVLYASSGHFFRLGNGGSKVGPETNIATGSSHPFVASAPDDTLHILACLSGNENVFPIPEKSGSPTSPRSFDPRFPLFFLFSVVFFYAAILHGSRKFRVVDRDARGLVRWRKSISDDGGN